MTCSLCGSASAVTLNVTIRVTPRRSVVTDECVEYYLAAERRARIASGQIDPIATQEQPAPMPGRIHTVSPVRDNGAAARLNAERGQGDLLLATETSE